MAKGKKHDLRWIKKTVKLEEGHNWQSQPDSQIFVAGRGALRFDVPQNWHLEPKEDSFRFSDKKPPDDNCCLEASFNLLPPNDWSDFPLIPLLKKIVKDDSRHPIETGKVIHLKRQTARIVWTEIKFIDPHENRPAYSRIAVGLGSGVQCLITFDYWEDEAEPLTPIWDKVMNSLVLGLFIRDPRTGFAYPD